MAASALFANAYWLFDAASKFLLPSLSVLALIGAGLLGLALMRLVPRWQIAIGALCIAVTITGFTSLKLASAPDGMKAGTPVMRVYQHNVWIKNPDVGQTVHAFTESGADIVALIEAAPHKFTLYEAGLAQDWPYQLTGETPPATYARLRLLSKYELADGEVHPAYNSPAWLRATVKSPSGDFTILMVHFTRPWPFASPSAQLRQYAGLVPVLNEIDGPLLLLGDFNSAAWGRLAGRLQRDHGMQVINHLQTGTWPNRMPSELAKLPWPRFMGIPIDLAFCRGEIACGHHRVGPAYGSDHRSVQFDVQLPARAPAMRE
ncbi:endonuclease/exonuclease/phosphatase family protein [Henriciella aquimarina]|uniref:endonuclease/exonuclease/phosphatase family protein n=1 Tax=Henriciella aquimarina TaxID=545261 RepID=UPI0009FCD42B|nr:endonuclease/exonuclease/phosphatase family protein [Henriciella aquimarina]